MSPFVRPLLRIAKLQGRFVLESLVTGSFDVVKGGKVMTQATATNKAFTFTIPQNFGPAEIMQAADEALAWIDSRTTDELDAFLARRASNVSVVRHC